MAVKGGWCPPRLVCITPLQLEGNGNHRNNALIICPIYTV